MAAMAAAVLLLVGLCGAGAAGPARLRCWFVEESGGRAGMMPSAVSQRPALLALGPAEPGLPLPADVEPGLAFAVLDPAGALRSALLLAEDPSAAGAKASVAPLACEVSGYTPQDAHVPWAVGLTPWELCPTGFHGPWFMASVQASAHYGVSSVLQAQPPLPQQPEGVTLTTAALSVFTRTPKTCTRLGTDVLLDCGFTAPLGPSFSVEWRYQHRGTGRVLLAYDGTAARTHVAEPGAELFLGDSVGGMYNVSLRLRNVGTQHDGTYICTVYRPHLHAQQAMELNVAEPPMVVLHPDPVVVAPGARVEVACEISGYFPLDVTVTWERREPGGAGATAVAETWQTGHRRGPNGTYALTSFAHLLPAQPGDHGTTITCSVAHVGLRTPLHRRTQLHVAGSSGPSLEDAVGLFLLAFLLYGAARALGGLGSNTEEENKKSE